MSLLVKAKLPSKTGTRVQSTLPRYHPASRHEAGGSVKDSPGLSFFASMERARFESGRAKLASMITGDDPGVLTLASSRQLLTSSENFRGSGLMANGYFRLRLRKDFRLADLPRLTLTRGRWQIVSSLLVSIFTCGCFDKLRLCHRICYGSIE